MGPLDTPKAKQQTRDGACALLEAILHRSVELLCNFSRKTARLDNFELPDGPVPILLSAPILLGSGVAIRIQSPELGQLRTAARQAMSGEFSKQDSQGWRPHVTIRWNSFRPLRAFGNVEISPRVTWMAALGAHGGQAPCYGKTTTRFAEIISLLP